MTTLYYPLPHRSMTLLLPKPALTAFTALRAWSHPRRSAVLRTHADLWSSEPVWVTCEAWEDLVDRLVKCKVGKGRQIAINGSLALNVFTPKDAPEGKKERRLYIKVCTLQVLGSAKDAEEQVQTATVAELPVETAKSARSRKRA